MKNKTIYWIGAIIGAYLIYRWWSKKQATNGVVNGGNGNGKDDAVVNGNENTDARVSTLKQRV